ncbi:MAG: replicative DNA helicase [Alphaproteobacteria bacterium]|jgi:replicative DNA helicase|nr:replicative DNA helicase [Alphaproteobacteria bacterium]MBT4019995.1 replicative DNA helicase [Alphaproteobacteria bacterium]MBT4966794.1 replicative DNA helicase [Alphaproteobacteria bacterium]MBT5917237.1 replicative DNA helicase [Alphaproteobacteria bacterium]MBT6387014.1 replicative DNA helicase [Alphaproteobacteria bacterium]
MENSASSPLLSPVDDFDQIDGPGYREQPSNAEAEQALLGAILINNEAAHRVNAFLMDEHFFWPVHGRIFGAANKLIERGQIATPTTLKTYFDRDEGLADVGGSDYLARLASAATTIINAEAYGNAIYDLYLRRELIDIGEDMVNGAYDSGVDDEAVKQIELAEKHLFDLAEKGVSDGGFVPFKTSLTEAVLAAEAAYKRDASLTGVTSGLTDLDELLGGMHRSDLVILAGRPSMGKTALATNIAFNAAKAWHDNNGKDGAVVGFFSLEMSGEQLATRILSEQSEISSHKIRRGMVSSDDFHTVARVARELEELPFFIDDTPALSIGAIRTRARRMKRQHGLSMLVIDYLQLIKANSAKEGRVQEVTEITQGLKAIAKDLDIPVLALSQLSRQVENRDDKRPQLSDLRESGSIEQDADVVMFVYREEYYWSRLHPRPAIARKDETEAEFILRQQQWNEDYMREGRAGEAEIIIAKQRHGPTDTVNVYFSNQFTRFGNLDKEDQGPDDVGF